MENTRFQPPAIRIYFILCILLFMMLVIPAEGHSFDGFPSVNPKPILKVENETLELSKGDNLTLECVGDYPMEWAVHRGFKLMEAADVLNLPGATIQELNSTESWKFRRQLTVVDLNYDFTGRYICRYSHRPDLNTSVYAFVDDAVHLFAPLFAKTPPGMPFYIMPVRNLRRAILPCRVTNLSATVQLYRQSYPPKLVPDDSDGLRHYDPTQGYILEYPHNFFSGRFYCLAKLGDKEKKSNFLLRFMAEASQPFPELDASSKTVATGDSFNLTCKVRVDKETSVLMQWSYTSNESSTWEVIDDDWLKNPEHSARIQRIDQYRVPMTTSGYVYDEIHGKLIVKNAQESDSGVYRCTVKTHDGKSNFREEVIKVYSGTFVYLTPEDTVVEAQEGDQLVHMRVIFNSFPTPVIEWFHPTGQEITKLDRYFKITNLDAKSALTIYSPARNDAGEYKVQGSTKDMNSSALVRLIVNYPPVVTIISNKSHIFFLVDSIHLLECKVESVPPPDLIQWQWQTCDVGVCQKSNNRWQNITQLATKGSNPLVLQLNNLSEGSSIKVTGNKSGIFRCTGANYLGQETNEMKFIASEVPNGFEASFSLDRFRVVGDTDLTWSCYASLWAYKSVSAFYRPGSGGEEIPLEIGGNRTTVEHTRSPYSWVVTLRFGVIEKEDAGYYGCQVVALDGNQTQIKGTWLVVNDIVAPYFLPEKTEGKIQTEKNRTFTLECPVDGTPHPDVYWYKDGDQIDPTNNSLDLHFADRNQKLTIRSTEKFHSGEYVCEAENRGGAIFSNWTLVVGADEIVAPAMTNIIVSIGVLSAVFIVAIIIVCVLWRRRTNALHKELEMYLIQPKGDYNPDIPIDEQTGCLPYDPKWEFPKDRLRLGMILGQGAFGRVVKAEGIGIVEHEDLTIVAVKMVKDCTDKEQMMALLSELKILIHIGQHLNIVNLLGAVTKDIRFGELYVIVEFCNFGNLRNYMLKNKDAFKDTMDDYLDPVSEKKREMAKEAALAKPYYVNKAQPETSADLIGPPLTTKNLICWSFQVSRGMEYLASKKYIHRDLAGRNVLLAEDNVVKICDFGLAKDCYKNSEYQKKGDGPVPVKWMAIESLTHRLYTSKSDVWSYGVLLWELFSLGGSPYPGVEMNEKFVELLKSGYRMDKPKFASDELYKVMRHCWEDDADDRPTFNQLSSIMGDLLEDNVKQYYLDLNTPYVKMSDLEQGATGGATGHDGYLRMSSKDSHEDYIPMSPAPLPPGEIMDFSDHSDVEESLRYVNEKKWKKEKADEFELQPMAGDVDGVVHRKTPGRQYANERGSQEHVETQALVHRNDDSDSGHSSYAPGTSPGAEDDNGYLVPKNAFDPLLSQEEKGKKSNESVLSCASSGIQSDYHYDDLPPPAYSAVMDEVSDTIV